MPANEVLQRPGIRSKQLEEQFTGEGWQWSTMAYSRMTSRISTTAP
ncbi:MAG: hypothetical protein R2854_22930 [Caldilineaceae bacterium]